MVKAVARDCEFNSGSIQVCKPAYLVPVPSQDKLGGLYQEVHPA